MANIHIFLQGKGGVGKSFCCTMLTQYLIDHGRPKPICIDTDPINATFAAYEAFDVMRVEIMDGDKVNPRKFDDIMDRICAASENESIIIDNGASSFIPFSAYMLSSGVPTLMAEMGHTLYTNTIITGGDAMEDTVQGFASVISQFPDTSQMVVWLNPYFGDISHNGKSFEDFPIYKSKKSKVCALVSLPELQPETFGFDLSRMLKDRLTFTQALGNDSEYHIMTKQRLKITRDNIYSKLAAVPEI